VKQQPEKAKLKESTSRTRSKKISESQADNITDDYAKQWQEYYEQMNNYNSANNQYFNAAQFPSNPAFSAQNVYPSINPYAPSYYTGQWGGYDQAAAMPGPVPPIGSHQWQMPTIPPPPPPPQFTNGMYLNIYVYIYDHARRKAEWL